MKKVLAVIVAAVMLVSLFSLVSHAEYMGKCFDGAFLTNNAGANTHVAGEGEKDIGSLVTAGEVGSIYGLGYQYIHAQGWFTDDDEFTDLGYQVNNGDINWGIAFEDINIIGATGGTYALRFNFNMPVSEGDVTVTFYEKLTNGDAKKAHAYTYSNKEPDPNAKQFDNYAILDNGGGAIGTWLNTTKDSAYVEFTTAGVFKAISLGIFWASNPNVPNGPKAKWTCELYKFAYNVENTLAQAPVKTKSVTSNADNDPAFKFDLEEEMPAGTYIVKFTITNANEPEVFVVDGEESSKNPYLVLPKIDNPDASKFSYYNDPFNLVLTGEVVSGDFFLANPEETEAPSSGTTTTGLVNPDDYSVSYFIDKTNATNWANGQIGDRKVTYYFNVEDDGLAIGVKASGLVAGEYVQLNFNPGNYLWEVPGQFISFVLGDTLTVLQHNHKNGLLADDNPGGADITAKVANQIVKTDDGFEFTAKLPKELFTITDVEGADAFVYGEDDLYFGMFLVAGGGGLSNQQNSDFTDWTCRGLNLNEYVFEAAAIVVPPTDEPNTQTGDAMIAMIAVIAVLAMGAAVVFAKKRSF